MQPSLMRDMWCDQTNGTEVGVSYASATSSRIIVKVSDPSQLITRHTIYTATTEQTLQGFFLKRHQSSSQSSTDIHTSEKGGREREGQREKDRDRDREKDRDRERERQTEKQRDRDTERERKMGGGTEDKREYKESEKRSLRYNIDSKCNLKRNMKVTTATMYLISSGLS